MYGIIAVVYGKAVAKLVCNLAVILFNMFNQVAVAAGKAASVAQSGAHLFYGKGRFVVCACYVCAFVSGQVVWVQFYTNAVHNLRNAVSQVHVLLLLQIRNRSEEGEKPEIKGFSFLTSLF